MTVLTKDATLFLEEFAQDRHSHSRENTAVSIFIVSEEYPVKTTRYLLSVLLSIPLLFSISIANAEEFTADQIKAIQSIIHSYIVENPNVLVEATETLQSQQQMAMQQEAQTVITDNFDELFHGSSPYLGKDNSNTVIVMFSDYQCIYCKNMAALLEEVLAEDNDIQLVIKELPINGPNSEYASKAALAANLQGKYPELHHALFNSNDSLTRSKVMQLARDVNIDEQQLREDIDNEQVQQELAENMEIAYQFRLLGTPIFVIASHLNDGEEPKFLFIPGAIEKQTLQEFITQVRQ